jgi:hypothetical protein
MTQGVTHYCPNMGAEERIAAALERLATAVERATRFSMGKAP